MATVFSKIRRNRGPVLLSGREQQVIHAAQNGIADELNLRAVLSEAIAGDLIVLAGVTITLTSQLSITKGVRFRSNGVTTITGTFGAELIAIDSLATGGAAEISFEGINFVQGSNDTDVIAVNNTGATGLTTVKFHRCSISVLDAAAVAYAIDVAHAVAGQGIAVWVSGVGSETCDAINFLIKNTADLLEIHSVKLQAQGAATAVVTSADNIAAKVRLYCCEVPHELATSGGHASQLLAVIRSWSRTSNTYAAADTNDLIGSQSEVIV